MIENNETASGRQEPNADAKQPTSEIELSEFTGELAGAVELLEPGKPLVLNEAFVVSSSGHMIMSQYVDIGVDKLRHRPSVVLKVVEAKYGWSTRPTFSFPLLIGSAITARRLSATIKRGLPAKKPRSRVRPGHTKRTTLNKKEPCNC